MDCHENLGRPCGGVFIKEVDSTNTVRVPLNTSAGIWDFLLGVPLCLFKRGIIPSCALRNLCGKRWRGKNKTS